jgi:hypothetical protein
MLTAHADRFTDLDMFRMFNVDMVLAGAMDAKEARGPNRFLWRFKPQTDVSKSDPASVSCKFDGDGNMTSGTDERKAMLAEHAKRVQADPELCPTLHK